MTEEQKQTLKTLNDALAMAMTCGALDYLQGACNCPDSINDVSDAVAAAISE